jgi:hypothetical protein
MKISDLIENYFEYLTESAVPVWQIARGKIKKSFRCVGGRRHGRVVRRAAICNKPINVAKSIRMRRLMKSRGKQIAQKANRTKISSIKSKKLHSMNVALKRALGRKK